MPLPSIIAFSPGDAVICAHFGNIGTAGGNNGTIRLPAPFRCYMKWIGVSPQDPMTGGPNTLAVLMGTTRASIAATASGLSLPAATGERGVFHFVFPAMAVDNFSERGDLIRITSGGEATTGPIANVTIVLGRR